MRHSNPKDVIFLKSTQKEKLNFEEKTENRLRNKN